MGDPSNTANRQKPISEQMRCGIFSNEHGDITIVYDHEFIEPIQWIEYNVKDNQFFLVDHEGIPKELGIELKGQMIDNIKKSKGVHLLLIQNKEIVKKEKVSLVLQDY